VPDELLEEQVQFPLSELFRQRTPEELAALSARETAANTAVHAEFARVLDTAGTHPAAAAVLRLHSPSADGRYCEGCDGDTDWPCRTTLLVAETMGVEMPDDPWTDAYRDAVV
jgi:hypothetical protein